MSAGEVTRRSRAAIAVVCWGRWWLVACALLLGLGVLVRVLTRWVPLGDNALMRMWVDAVGGPHTPLVGGDSRFGWNHLGPWLFYLLAVPYRLLAGSPRGLLVGAGLINIGSLLLIARIVRSVIGDWVAALVVFGSVLSVLTARGPRLVDPWNPYVPQLLLAVAIVACWATVAGDRRWLTWLIAAGSVAVQAHIAFLPPVGALVVLAGVSLVKRAPGRLRLWPSAVVFVIAWAPAAIDLVLPGRHNAWRVVRYFGRSDATGTSSPAPRGGLGVGVRVVLRETGLGADWLGGRPGVELFTQGFNGHVGLAPGVGLVALAASGILAWRRRDRRLGALVVVLAALVVVAVAEMSSADGPLYPYLFGWVSTLGMISCLTPLIVWHTRRSGGTRPAERSLLAVRVAALAVSAGVLATSFDASPPRSPLEQRADGQRVVTLVDLAIGKLDLQRSYRLVHGADGYNSIFELGVVDELRARGVWIVADPSEVVLFGRQMVDRAASTLPRLDVVAPFYGADPGEQVVAVNDPLSPADRVAERRLTATLTALYRREGCRRAAELISSVDSDIVPLAALADPDPNATPMLDELTRLRAQGRPFAIVLLDPPAPPPPNS